jgi:hypothetical protein
MDSKVHPLQHCELGSLNLPDSKSKVSEFTLLLLSIGSTAATDI